jgi:hypothetical protein
MEVCSAELLVTVCVVPGCLAGSLPLPCLWHTYTTRPALLTSLQRIMEIRSQIAKEWVEELKQVGAQGGGTGWRCRWRRNWLCGAPSGVHAVALGIS